MSEYQYVAFRAVDRPLTERELDFARKQSTRAEITRWSFTNEYHFGDFHGDTDGLLRRGYDVHLHYANFGVRRISLRIPAGLPFHKSLWSKYIGTGELCWKKDSKGNGGILTVDPFYEPGEIEEIWSPGDYLEGVVEIRNRLVAGDLRTLYLLWLCAAFDSQSDPLRVIEPPVPGGLAEFAGAGAAMLQFFGLDPLILKATSEGAAAIPSEYDQDQQVTSWVDGLTDTASKRYLQKFLIGDPTAIKAELIATIRKTEAQSTWPISLLGRSFHYLLERTEALRAEQNARERDRQDARARREAARRERERQARMAEMAKDPKKWLRKAEQMVEARGTQNYEAAAEMLADLREAVGSDDGEQMTRQHAAHLTKKHPTLNRLKSSLRKRNLL